jgi:hypothetical protein
MQERKPVFLQRVRIKNFRSIAGCDVAAGVLRDCIFEASRSIARR